MFQLGKTIVSEDIIKKDFVCNLSACKGACCVEGEAGAPITEEEVEILKEIYPKVKPFLRPEGIEAIEKQGTYIKTDRHELETPLVEGKECAYVTLRTKASQVVVLKTLLTLVRLISENLFRVIYIPFAFRIIVNFPP